MKTLLSLILAALMIAAALASCAVAPTALDPHIRLTSSDGESAAEWLSDRLGDKLTDSVVLGTKANGYGVDVSALEADGYFIRSLGGEIALFAKTADGLDRAVRKYAKMVESGSAIADVTYHEGYRVKRIEIAGRDVSEFTIYTGDEARILAAAKTFADRIKQACGASLSVVTGEPAAPYIALRYVHDETLGNVGHRWSVTADGVTIECSDKYKPQSASFAVTRFLERNLDWIGLFFGKEDLAAAEVVSIPLGTAFEETPDFEWVHSCSGQGTKYESLPNTTHGYGLDLHSSHGMYRFRFAGDLSASPNHDWKHDQPCWLDENFYDCARDDIVAYIEGRIASGEVPGEDLIFVDVAHGDNNVWCKCKKCSKMYGAEGSHAAEILTWINRLSDELDEIYPGILYGIFAYELTKTPPKTVKPNEHIFITFCYDRSCSSHPLDGSKCTTYDQWPDEKNYSNVDLTGRLNGWLSMTKNVSVWYYGIHNTLNTMSFLHTLREDVKFLRDSGVRGIYWESHDAGFSANWIAMSLHAQLMWNVDMSDEEFEALTNRLFEQYYGDAAADMRQFVDALGRIEEYGSCYHCWGALMDEPAYYPAVDADAFAAKYDELFALIERTAALADSALEEERIVMQSCALIYKGSLCAYPIAKAAGDEARMAQLCERYGLIDERLSRYGMDMTNGATLSKNWTTDFKRTLKEIFSD